MIPLTESLYVPAKLADTERVLVDVGTGYYVQVGRRPASTQPGRPCCRCYRCAKARRRQPRPGRALAAPWLRPGQQRRAHGIAARAPRPRAAHPRQMGSEAASEFCQRKTTKMEGTLKTVTKVTKAPPALALQPPTLPVHPPTAAAR